MEAVGSYETLNMNQILRRHFSEKVRPDICPHHCY